MASAQSSQCSPILSTSDTTPSVPSSSFASVVVLVCALLPQVRLDEATGFFCPACGGVALLVGFAGL